MFTKKPLAGILTPSPVLSAVAFLLQLRWQNVLGLVFAQYVAALFLFNKAENWASTLFDYKLHFLIIAVGLLTAGGYIINNFYDREKDRINRPIRTAIESSIPKAHMLYTYFIVTMLGSLVALGVSFRAFLFYSGYAFLLWAYSHKFKKITLLGNLIATFLVVIPFFGLILYYNEIHPLMVYYGFFYSWMLFIRESVKDLRFYKGDVALGYQTVPVALGLSKAVRMLRVYALVGVLIALGVWLLSFKGIHFSSLAKGFSVLTIIAYSYIIFFFKTPKRFRRAAYMHMVLKGGLFSGILIIPFLFH
jgi:4-hydroxybenzoate polyprenyltransferase